MPADSHVTGKAESVSSTHGRPLASTSPIAEIARAVSMTADSEFVAAARKQFGSDYYKGLLADALEEDLKRLIK